MKVGDTNGYKSVNYAKINNKNVWVIYKREWGLGCKHWNQRKRKICRAKTFEGQKPLDGFSISKITNIVYG